ncbi:uncharacterized protein [Enoplosus armatus]|uniref:uncharacterized protein n=1 Tax=Enoplosus armatus TaxID=215367 RepID=UPI003995A999
MIFLILVFLLGGLWETEAMSVTGVLGKEITIHCSHINAFSNIKYFCKGTCRNEDVLISSRKKKKDSNDKYSIIDEGNTFKVTISRLTEDDSETYWCGIERTGLDTYNKVVLTVIVGERDVVSFSEKLVYIGAGLGVVVLALAVLLLIFFRHRNRDIGASSGKEHDTVYATPSSQKHHAHHITASSSAASKDQKTDGRANSVFSSSSVQHQDTSTDHADNIYANVTVSSEPPDQPESLFYSTVSFNKHSDCSTVTPRTAEVTYSTVLHLSTDEPTIAMSELSADHLHYSHENNDKFLCKGKDHLNCEELIHTTEEDRDVVKGRFDIRDNKRRKYFYVNIHNVSRADSGTYWCGSDRTWQHAKFNKILLSVAEKQVKTKGSDPATSKTKPTSVTRTVPEEKTGKQDGIIAGGVCALLLVVLVIILILCRHNLPRTQACCAAGESSEERTNAGHNTEGNHGDHHYEDIQMRNQQASSGVVLPSVYATVNPPADQLHYATINVQTDSVSVSTDGNALPDTNKNGPSACDYSSISSSQGATHSPAAEQTLYSAVTKPEGP